MIPLAHADRDITDIATRLPHLSACGTKKLKDFQTLSFSGSMVRHLMAYDRNFPFHRLFASAVGLRPSYAEKPSPC